MIDTFTVGTQTLVLIFLAKAFVKRPPTIHGGLVALLKTFLFFMPILLAMSWVIDVGAKGWMSLTFLAFELSFVAVLFVSIMKAILRRLPVAGVDN